MITAETRRESNRKTDKITRQLVILEALGNDEMTAREIAYKLHFTDLNAVKPRLTELVKLGKIKTSGKKYDTVTDRNVAVYRRVEDTAKSTKDTTDFC